jgi:hypothetical protein
MVGHEESAANETDASYLSMTAAFKRFSIKPARLESTEGLQIMLYKKQQLDCHIAALFAMTIILYQNFSLQLFDNKSILSIFAVPNLMGIINCLIN